MSRLLGASTASLLLVALVISGYALLPRPTRQQTLATLRQPDVQQDAPPTTPVASATPAPTPTPVPTARPTATPTVAPSPTATPIPADIQPTGPLGASLDRYLNNLVEAKLFHGAVLVARGNRIILSKGYGPADLDRGITNSANTRMRIASLTKQFTAMATLQLVDQGKLRVDDLVCQYIEQCPERWSAITVRMLLNHTHGLPNYTDFPSFERDQMKPITVEQLLDRLRGQWPVWTPGESYHYGNSGYVLLGAIIERISGQSYAEFLRSQIFAPLGMHNTGVTYAPEPGGKWALPYQSFSRLAPPLHTSTLYASGALYSTVEDMYRWDQALYTNKLVSAELRKQMFTPGLGRYGFGWKIVEDSGRLRVGHPGEMDGCKSVILRYPNEQVTVIVIANMHAADADGIAAYLARITLDS
ncbi:MAG: beta-lactamase family protein [Roseiflexaceae bacterium]|nr:beta-lactamase family protein [Roseiflexaceae bacterium]